MMRWRVFSAVRRVARSAASSVRTEDGSITAPPLSLAAWAAYSIPAGYLWLLVAWVLHLRGKKAGPAKKKSAKSPRKAAKD